MRAGAFNSSFSKWLVPELTDPSSNTFFCDGWYINFAAGKKDTAAVQQPDASGALVLEPLRRESTTGLRMSMRVPAESLRIMSTLPANVGRVGPWRFTIKLRALPSDSGYPTLDNVGLFKQEGTSRKWIGAISDGRALNQEWQRVTAKVANTHFGATARYVMSVKFSGRGIVEIDSCRIEVALKDIVGAAIGDLTTRIRLRMARARHVEGDSRLEIDPELSQELMQHAFLGPDAITGDFADLKGVCHLTRVSPLLIRFLATDREAMLRSYLVRADRPQVLALQETRGPIEMIAASGQSLSTGGPPGTPLSITVPPSPHRCIRLTTESANDPGTLGVGNRPFAPTSVKGFAPAVEGTAPSRGESQGTSLMRWLDGAISAAGGEHRTFLYRSHGQGGQEISKLKSETQPYRNGLLEIERALRIARIYKRRLVVRAVTWSHGEADRKAITPRDTYVQALRALRVDYDRDIRKTTGQSEPVHLLVDQLAASATGEGPSEIAMAQLQAVEEDPLILMSCPKYFLQGDYGYLDAVHLKSLGYDVLGEYHAKVWHDVFVDGRTWTGLRPKSIAITGPNCFDVEFHVPVEPLVLDSTALPKFNGEFGFSYDDLQGGSLKRGGVTVLNGTTLRFVTNADIRERSGRTLRYAYDDLVAPVADRSAVWGNLRDSDSRRSIAVPGLALSNWCVSFVSHF